MAYETHLINAKMVKIIGTKFPRLRTMIRNHPYTKIVGMSVIKCLVDEMGLAPDKIDEALLEEMIERGIQLYHQNEAEINAADTLEQKRQLLCHALMQKSDETDQQIAVG